MPIPQADGIPVYCAFTKLVKTASLKPHPRNPNKHPQEQIEIFAKVVKHLGWRQPIVVSKRSGYVVKGHGKLLVAQALDAKEVPVDFQQYATEDEEWQDLLADNRIAELSEREDSEIAALLKDLTARGAQLEFTGYDTKEITSLLTRLGRGEEDAESEPDLENAGALLKKWKVKPGQIWALRDHRLICGDSTEKAVVGALYDAMTGSVTPPHLMVTDPPYGVEYDADWRRRAGMNKNRRKMGKVANDDRADWTPAWSLFRGDVAYVWHGARHAAEVARTLEAAKFEIRAQIIWGKDRMVLSRGNYHWQHEPCWYAVREGQTAHWTGHRDQTTLWAIPAREDAGHGHSTQKPIACMRRPIENNSLIGEGVYDPFLGSGTTLIAAESTKRVCFGIELNPLYVAVSLQRWADFSHETPTLFNK